MEGYKHPRHQTYATRDVPVWPISYEPTHPEYVAALRQLCPSQLASDKCTRGTTCTAVHFCVPASLCDSCWTQEIVHEDPGVQYATKTVAHVQKTCRSLQEHGCSDACESWVKTGHCPFGHDNEQLRLERMAAIQSGMRGVVLGGTVEDALASLDAVHEELQREEEEEQKKQKAAEEGMTRRMDGLALDTKTKTPEELAEDIDDMVF